MLTHHAGKTHREDRVQEISPRWRARVPAQALASTISNLFPSGSLNSNMGGTPGHRSRSPTSMPRCRRAACSVSASGTRNRMPVSAPVSGLAISATEVDALGAATVTQRKLSPIRTSSRFSKPSVPTKNSTALSWSLTGIPTVPMSVMVVWDMTISSYRWKRLLLRLGHERARRGQRPVRLDRSAELVLRPDHRIGDRLPQALGRGADVDLEDLLHLVLQLVLQADEPGSPRLGVLADPPVVDQTDRDRVEVVQLL